MLIKRKFCFKKLVGRVLDHSESIFGLPMHIQASYEGNLKLRFAAMLVLGAENKTWDQDTLIKQSLKDNRYSNRAVMCVCVL